MRALIYNATNREVEAQQDLEVAMAAEQHVDFYEARYQSRLALKDWEGALADIAVCERLAMAPVKSVGLRGWVEYWRADLEAASAHFDAALKLDPKDGSALCGRCQLLERQGAEPDALIDACTLAIDAMPNHLETWLVRSKAHQAKEDFKLAAQDADAVLALDSTHVQAALSRAWISLLDEDFDDAKRRSAELLVRFPDDVSAIVLAGELALHDEDLPEAKKHFERALKLAPEGWNYTERVIEVLAAMRPVR